jgi:hypothetical protein
MRGFLPFKGFLYIHEASSYLVSKVFFLCKVFLLISLYIHSMEYLERQSVIS